MSKENISQDDEANMPCSGKDISASKLTIENAINCLHQQSVAIIDSKYFEGIVTASTLLSSILVGIETYPSMGMDLIFEVLDCAIYTFLIVELFVKAIALRDKLRDSILGPEGFWNCFDILYAVAVLIPLGRVKKTALMIFRMMRLGKFSHKVPLLHTIVVGLLGGLQNVAYIVAFLFSALYFFSIVGVCLFKGNDPWGFRSLHVSLLTLFRSATLDDWTDVMYVNIFGCEDFTIGDLYSTDPSVVLNSGRPPTYFLCTTPTPQPFVTSFFWLIFIATCSFIVLSLFIGAVTMSMSDSMSRMKEDISARQREKRREKAQRNAEMLARHKEREEAFRKNLMQEAQRARNFASVGNLLVNHLKIKREAEKSAGALVLTKEQRHIKMLLEQAWSGFDLDVQAPSKERRDMLGTLFAYENELAEEDTNVWKLRYIRLSRACTRYDEKEWVGSVIIALTLLTGVLIGVGTYEDSLPPPLLLFVSVLNWAVKVIFLLEVLVRICAEEFRPWAYFNKASNVVDFATAAGAFASGSSDLFIVLRLLRLLRLLDLLKSLPQLQVIAQSVVMSLNSIAYVSLVLFVFFYFFAVIGTLLFRRNDPFHFGVLHLAMFSLMRCATLDNWSSIMYTNIYGCNVYGYEERQELCTDPVGRPVTSVAFFGTVIILGAFVLLTLFIGVVTNSMEEASKELETKIQVEQNVVSVRLRYTMSDEAFRAYRRIFSYLDLDNSGAVATDELAVGLEIIGQRPTSEDLTALFNTVDRNCSGEVDFAEFLEFMMRLKSHAAKALQNKFDSYYSSEPFDSLGGAAADLVKSSNLRGSQSQSASASRIFSFRRQVQRTISKIRTDTEFREKVLPAESIGPAQGEAAEARGTRVSGTREDDRARLIARQLLRAEGKIHPADAGSDGSDED